MDSRKTQVVYILVMRVVALANTTETEMNNFLDRFNEAFYRNAAPFAAGFLIGFAVCFLRFVW